MTDMAMSMSNTNIGIKFLTEYFSRKNENEVEGVTSRSKYWKFIDGEVGVAGVIGEAGVVGVVGVVRVVTKVHYNSAFLLTFEKELHLREFSYRGQICVQKNSY